ncbi:hypothetical protein UFOVP510_3 [uncultured Caudovirales phage]|uniref:Uncharacterized protein n=1 Tax=uncultured Caudovirales phage TaxID=2100421 RepID=A0A6J5MJN8_9CAUD|nr:hypothetical protein UFOVP510_3 [uncultured Caudovirales phage]
MSRFIPVEPEKWGEMVKALSEVTRLKAEVERLTEEQKIKAVPIEAKIMDRLAELKAEVARLKSKNNLLREAGDDLWYCIRHNDKLGMQEAVEEWKDARHE